MSKKYFLVASVMFICALCCSCKTKERFADDSPQKGTIYISVDESFKPIIEEMIKMYESMFPATEIIASYKPEASCIRDFFRDSLNRVIIVTRGLNDYEERFFMDSLNYHPKWNKVATDAIAILVNNNSTDTLFTKERIKDQLLGKINRHQTIVFDGLSATSNVRYISDSILRGEKFDTSVVRAAKSSSEVIDYVSTHENAVGMVGISWIGNPEDTAQVNLLKKVKIAFVKCQECVDSPYVKPMQASILSRRYPLVRGLYYVIKENYQGLGTGFVSFLKSEKGQLIFRRAYLSPIMEFGIRNVKINQSLPKD